MTSTAARYVPSTREALAAAEAARQMHYTVATSTDVEVNHCLSPVYKASQRLFLATIKLAYPSLNARRIYELWVDCMESIEYCVDYIRRNGYPY